MPGRGPSPSAQLRGHHGVDDADDQGRQQGPDDGYFHGRHDELGEPDDHSRRQKADDAPVLGRNPLAHEGLHDVADYGDGQGCQQGIDEAHDAEAGQDESEEQEDQGRHDEADYGSQHDTSPPGGTGMDWNPWPSLSWRGAGYTFPRNAGSLSLSAPCDRIALRR